MGYNGVTGARRNNDRKNKGIKGIRPDHYAARKAGADERREARARVTPLQQLEELDRRLGVEVGAKKERARLEALNAAELAPKKTKEKR